jgi:hypothetical protein
MVTALLEELEVVADEALVELEDFSVDDELVVGVWVVLDPVSVVALVIEGLMARASPIRRATLSSAANTTGRLSFKAQKKWRGDI